MTDITSLLSAAEQGDLRAADELLPLVYDELRRLAAQKLAGEKPGQTLDATGLVHEAYLRLTPRAPAATDQAGQWEGRGHFFAAAAEAMRRILVESARRKRRLKHGGEFDRVIADERELAVDAPDDDLLAVHESLDMLAEVDKQAAEIVKLHFFAGLTLEEVASLLSISTRTAYRNWAFARAWLARRLGRSES